MDKKKQMNFNLNNFLLAVKDILDVRDIEQNNVSKNHSLRVAYLSLKIAEKLEKKPKEMFDLCAYSLFYHYIQEEHKILFGFDEFIDELAKIADFTHSIDEKFDLSKEQIKNRRDILNYVEQSEVSKYKDIFLDISNSIDFWLDLQNENIMMQYIYSTLYDFTQVLTFEEVLKITSMFGSIENDINRLLENCVKMTEFYGFEHKERWTFLIAASMVNFGKLSVPFDILYKKEKLTDDEYELLKSNIYHNKNALNSIYEFQDIAKWATRHQERLDGFGYPSKIMAKDLSLKERLMAVLNSYDALVTKREYRNSFSKEEAINILILMEKNYYLDKTIVEDFISII